MRLRSIAIQFAAALAIATCQLPAHAADTCISVAQDGNCLDDTAPSTGQFTTTPNDHGIVGVRATQAHANVRITEATYVLAHNICRYVNNPTSGGRGLFIGLEEKEEWVSFINQPPAGANLNYCCQPITVSVCGKNIGIPFAQNSQSFTYTGGDSYQATYTCGTGISGSAPTQDTSWQVAQSGSCDPKVPDQICRHSPRGEYIECSTDGGQTWVLQDSDPSAGHDGEGPGHSSGGKGSGSPGGGD